MSLLFGYAGTIVSVVGFQLKKQSHIIFSQFVANLLVALSYIALGLSKMAGGAVCMVGAIQTLINYFYLKKDKTPPKVLTAVFLVVDIVVVALTMYFSGDIRIPYDLFPMLSSVIFIIGVSTKNSTLTRFLFVANMFIWISYDAMAAPVAVANLVTHICILISLIVGIIRYDILKKEE